MAIKIITREETDAEKRAKLNIIETKIRPTFFDDVRRLEAEKAAKAKPVKAGSVKMVNTAIEKRIPQQYRSTKVAAKAATKPTGKKAIKLVGKPAAQTMKKKSGR